MRDVVLGRWKKYVSNAITKDEIFKNTNAILHAVGDLRKCGDRILGKAGQRKAKPATTMTPYKVRTLPSLIIR